MSKEGSNAAANAGFLFAVFSAFQQVEAGKAAQRASVLNAFGMETDTQLDRVQASQQMNAIKQQYDDATSSNIAALSATGRDVGSDRSVKAFMEKQKQIVGTDVKRLGDQSQLRLLGGRQQAAAERTSGRMARRAANLQALNTLAEGATSYAKTTS